MKIGVGCRFCAALSVTLVSLLAASAAVQYWRIESDLGTMVEQSGAAVSAQQQQWTAQREVRQTETTASLLRLVADIAPAAIASFDLSALLQYATTISEMPDVAYVAISSSEGTTIAEAGQVPAGAPPGARLKIQRDGVALGEVTIVPDRTAFEAELAQAAKLKEEKLAAIRQSGAQLLDSSLISIVGFGLLTMLTALALSATSFRFLVFRPINAIKDYMSSLAAGDLTREVPGLGKADEMGAMAQAVQVFKDNAIAKARLEAEQAEGKRRAEAERRETMERLAAKFEADVNGIVQAVASAAAQMQATAETMSATAGRTSRQAAGVASASQQASGNVQMVAAAAEELAASIREISRQMAQSHTIARGATDEAEKARSTVKALAEVAHRIGAVVTLINDIAGQTNLLALNATIEAARAGDAGKGFAVVASEVKALATQTTKATDEIASQIAAVQGEINGTVGAIEGIAATISRINEIAATIAAAVEEQQAATAEIARNVEQASSGTQEVSSTISTVTTAAGETGTAAGDVLTAARQLSQQATTMQDYVGRFVHEVRAA